MPIKRFKKGDIVVPLSTRKSSNYYNLRNIKKVKVINPRSEGWQFEEKPKMRVRIIEGFVNHSQDNYHYSEGHDIQVTVDAFKLAIEEKSIYPIY